eukprot:CAMPEP_0196759954 /NCGR_PEP_ID=MMETSP1091-20130531/104966_1 /TAXON_ID=302021 /ORGANISM="Rhodomonas sp., Strain CCMP768" /LENGTH=171 /DNA_ID=CAMNT_0042108819 /DNA_START=105 /DNA_END=617 /DNA_ORIENTATION=+
MGRAVTRIQPSFSSSFVHLSGAAAQHDLADAINEPEEAAPFAAHQPDAERETHGLEGDDDRGRLHRNFHGEAARARLMAMALECRQFVVLKWSLEVAFEGYATAIAFALAAVAVVHCLGRWKDDKGSTLGSWFNSFVVLRLARAIIGLIFLQHSLLGHLLSLAPAFGVVVW